MSHISEKAMPHAQPQPGQEFDAESGKFLPIETDTLVEVLTPSSSLGWVLGAVGAGVAVAAGAAALLSLRSSTPKKPARRRAARKPAVKATTPKATKPSTTRRRAPKKAATAAA